MYFVFKVKTIFFYLGCSVRNAVFPLDMSCRINTINENNTEILKYLKVIQYLVI